MKATTVTYTDEFTKQEILKLAEAVGYAVQAATVEQEGATMVAPSGFVQDEIAGALTQGPRGLRIDDIQRIM